MREFNENGETGCCPKFNPAPWEEKEINWKDKLFIKNHVRSFFHIPINFGSVMAKSMKKIIDAGALEKDFLTLSDEKSLWTSDLYISVSKPFPEAQLEKISGTFLTKVFEGSYKNVGQWIKDTKEWVRSKGKEVTKLYFFYTTCPKCAKVYGKNYVVILAKI